MSFMNGSKLYLKNPLEMFKGVNRPEDRENLVDIFYVGFHKRAFSKISSQRTSNSYGITGKDLAEMQKVGIKSYFSLQRGATTGTAQGGGNQPGFGERDPARRDLESGLCQGPAACPCQTPLGSSTDSWATSSAELRGAHVATACG